MLENLGLVNLRLVEGTATAAEEESVRAQLEYVLEALAEAEHDGWTEWHLARGWRYAPSRDDENRLHPCLLPFRQLPKVDVDKDRDAVRHYPDFARGAGMKIVVADGERSERGKLCLGYVRCLGRPRGLGCRPR
jgi:hypothetical protein